LGSERQLSKVDSNIVLNEVVADLKVALDEAGASIEAGKLPVIGSYGTGIKQLFQNLIANGIKFKKTGIPPVLKIAAEEQAGFWQFSFTDNGIGIEKQHSEKIFVIFQRLHSRKEYEGSGIGLAHCKKIVEQHKGRIWVESTPGESSTFYFTIQKNHTL
jgi:light-regulated signal transduction histidine kinase (bacteriophytochrome)